ncbi:hypothetical protein PD335_005266 [Salmonella enterica]|uniref:Uncharacterized protein n=1 Tax=Salmonella enterica TaxID=28901 RepID=A0A753T055_SALER|nr:hypothetical protein [Salmonella enterica subsp. enterica serovar Lattenkamp]EHA4003133.1 hypothetical protein [Salmonella enterica]EHG8444806.1 hypothetical protein [Salmonella enterica subsp. enterica]EHA4005215.1 hypothetical protein [Salmonella enterica]EHM1181809.1 hypothetical protein [Salmonella enterica subsp. enterica serovar Lattenkamp]
MMAKIILMPMSDILSDGIYAQVAVYSDHFRQISVRRNVLLRMISGRRYLYFDY